MSSGVMSIKPTSANTILINTSGISSKHVSLSITPSQPMSSITGTTKTSKKSLVLEVSLKYNGKFDNKLYDRQSSQFKNMMVKVKEDITKAYRPINVNVSVFIIAFKPGSIVCDVLLVFQNSTRGDIPYFKQTLEKYGDTRGFEVSELKSYNNDDDNGDDDEVILGLDWWQIGVIIAGIVAFILLITIIVLCCKISRIQKKSGNVSSYVSGPFYDIIDGNEEMKILRATPTSTTKLCTTSADGKGDVESGQRKVNMYSSTSYTDVKNDGLVKETTSKIGKDNSGADINDNDYVTIMEDGPGSGDVLKL
ncbi:uncharacterized protein LOC114529581 [Dendronephthya gigantea]|uniref:uncharacterized protein LOC114529581 n=1 Tax=Dendronephthya gigantea TaxID=151771 RepID=UPI00106C7E9B|nr:uncharacterized protein LOC114529581 [Dendronephthya gigantea]